jgi:hypothetical protein
MKAPSADGTRAHMANEFGGSMNLFLGRSTAPGPVPDQRCTGIPLVRSRNSGAPFALTRSRCTASGTRVRAAAPHTVADALHAAPHPGRGNLIASPCVPGAAQRERSERCAADPGPQEGTTAERENRRRKSAIARPSVERSRTSGAPLRAFGATRCTASGTQEGGGVALRLASSLTRSRCTASAARQPHRILLCVI